MNMKWSKNWVAAAMLVPGIFLASCGSGGNNNETSDTLSTQSAPPSDDNSSTYDTQNMGDSSTTSGTGVGATPGTSGTTGTTDAGSSVSPGTSGTKGTPGSTGSDISTSGTNRAVTGTTGETKRTTATKKRSYRSSTGISRTKSTGTTGTARTSITDQNTTDDRTSSITGDPSTTTQSSSDIMTGRDTTSALRDVTDTASNRVTRLGDTVSSSLDRMGDTASQRLRGLGATASDRMRQLGDTASDRLRQLGGDTSGTGTNTTFDSTRGNQGNIYGMTGQEKTGNYADTTGTGTDTSRGNTSTMDAGMSFTPSRFIPGQIRANYAEIKMARMAIEQSGNDDVKRIAKTIENDHNALLRQLQTLARTGNMTSDSIPTMENDQARSHLEMMKGMSGLEFNTQWLQHMHTMHEQKIMLFEQAEANNSIPDTDLRNWVSKTLPILRKHRDQLAQAMTSTNK